MWIVETTVIDTGSPGYYDTFFNSTDYEGMKLYSNGVIVGNDPSGDILTIYNNKSEYVNDLKETKINYNDFQVIREEYEDILYNKDFLPATPIPSDAELEW